MIVLKEEEKGGPETCFVSSRVGRRYKGNQEDTDTVDEIAGFPNTFAREEVNYDDGKNRTLRSFV